MDKIPGRDKNLDIELPGVHGDMVGNNDAEWMAHFLSLFDMSGHTGSAETCSNPFDWLTREAW